jgi:hypothetical protein
MSRDAIVAAVTTADAQGDSYHVEPCPRCKQTIKLPVDQLRHALPAGWTPAEPAEEAAAPAAEEPVTPTAPVEASAAPAAKDKPRHRHAAHKSE